jgi:hypothetical protein
LTAAAFEAFVASLAADLPEAKSATMASPPTEGIGGERTQAPGRHPRWMLGWFVGQVMTGDKADSASGERGAEEASRRLTPSRLTCAESLDSRRVWSVVIRGCNVPTIKCEDGDEEKFDHEDHAQCFDWIRSHRPNAFSSHRRMGLGLVPRVRRLARAHLGDDRKIGAERESACTCARRCRTHLASNCSRQGLPMRLARARSPTSHCSSECAR